MICIFSEIEREREKNITCVSGNDGEPHCLHSHASNACLFCLFGTIHFAILFDTRNKDMQAILCQCFERMYIGQQGPPLNKLASGDMKLA